MKSFGSLAAGLKGKEARAALLALCSNNSSFMRLVEREIGLVPTEDYLKSLVEDLPKAASVGVGKFADVLTSRDRQKGMGRIANALQIQDVRLFVESEVMPLVSCAGFTVKDMLSLCLDLEKALCAAAKGSMRGHLNAPLDASWEAAGDVERREALVFAAGKASESDIAEAFLKKKR